MGERARRRWAVGDGTILETRDHGKTWRAHPADSTNTFLKVWGSGPYDVSIGGYVGGAGEPISAFEDLTPAELWTSSAISGFVLHSTNGGTTFQVLTEPTRPSRDVTVGVDIYRLSRSGALLRSTDAGKTFAPVAAAAGASLASIWAIDATDAYAVGTEGTIFQLTALAR